MTTESGSGTALPTAMTAEFVALPSLLCVRIQ